jgi:hypothetical protein
VAAVGVAEMGVVIVLSCTIIIEDIVDFYVN